MPNRAADDWRRTDRGCCGQPVRAIGRLRPLPSVFALSSSCFASLMQYRHLCECLPRFPLRFFCRPTFRSCCGGCPVRFDGGARCAYELETQGAGDGRCLDQFDRHRIAEPIGHGTADESATGLVEAEIFIADKARRNQTVGAGFVEFDEQAGAGDAGNMAVETWRRRDRRENARSAGRRSRARPSWRGVRSPRCWRRFRQARGLSVPSGKPSGAELERADQRAMHDQIGVAADRRGEVGVAAKIEAEMAVILRRIFRLRLAAQNHQIASRTDADLRRSRRRG